MYHESPIHDIIYVPLLGDWTLCCLLVFFGELNTALVLQIRHK